MKKILAILVVAFGFLLGAQTMLAQKPMKALLINGSPHANGNTALALKEIEKVFTDNGIEVETIQVGSKDIRGCIGCGKCSREGKCVFDDLVNGVAPKFEEADCLILGSPVYYASPNGTLISFLDRLFYSTSFDKRMKVGAAVVVARRGGTTASFDVLNKYFMISGMPVVSGQYWNILHGGSQGEVVQDEEGMQNMRTLANNAVFLMKSIALGKKEFDLPEKEPTKWTNFIR